MLSGRAGPTYCCAADRPESLIVGPPELGPRGAIRRGFAAALDARSGARRADARRRRPLRARALPRGRRRSLGGSVGTFPRAVRGRRARGRRSAPRPRAHRTPQRLAARPRARSREAELRRARPLRAPPPGFAPGARAPDRRAPGGAGSTPATLAASRRGRRRRGYEARARRLLRAPTSGSATSSAAGDRARARRRARPPRCARSPDAGAARPVLLYGFDDLTARAARAASRRSPTAAEVTVAVTYEDRAGARRAAPSCSRGLRDELGGERRGRARARRRLHRERRRSSTSSATSSSARAERAEPDGGARAARGGRRARRGGADRRRDRPPARRRRRSRRDRGRRLRSPDRHGAAARRVLGGPRHPGRGRGARSRSRATATGRALVALARAAVRRHGRRGPARVPARARPGAPPGRRLARAATSAAAACATPSEALEALGERDWEPHELERSRDAPAERRSPRSRGAIAARVAERPHRARAPRRPGGEPPTLELRAGGGRERRALAELGELPGAGAEPAEALIALLDGSRCRCGAGRPRAGCGS